MKFLVIVAIVSTLAGCAKSAPALVAADNTITASLLRVKGHADTLCSTTAPVLTVEACKSFYSVLTPTLEAGAAYNRAVAAESFNGFTALVTSVGRLLEEIKKIPPPNRGGMEANLRMALGIASK